MFNPTAATKKRRTKKPQQQRHRSLFDYKSMACRLPFHLPPQQQQQCQRQSAFPKSAVLCALTIFCVLASLLDPAFATPTPSTNQINPKNINVPLFSNARVRVRGVRGIDNSPRGHISPNNNNYRFLEQQNEYDSSSSGVSILDDDTLRLSLAIDEDSAGGLSAPSPNIPEPKVFLRISGESGMIKPAPSAAQEENQEKKSSNKNEIVIRRRFRFPTFRASLRKQEEEQRRAADLHVQSTEEGHEGGEEEDDEMSDNYHLHFPYIESYREKYVRPDFSQLTEATHFPPPRPTSQPSKVTSKKITNPLSSKSKQKEWTEIIAQATTPSSLNEINTSSSEHRLADLNFRANLPAYFYNKYSSYSEEDLENVADLDDEHSKYFVKTRPRSLTATGSKIYNNFYYEPPSFSTKSVPIPVKTNKEKVVFASAKPTEVTTRYDEQNNHHHQNGGQVYLGHDDEDDDDEQAQQDSPVMSPLPTNFSSHTIPILTPQQINYDREAERNQGNKEQDENYSNESLLKTSASSSTSLNRNYQNHKYQPNHGSDNSERSSAETLDVSTSQSILSKVTLNNPHHPQLVIIKAEPIKTTASREYVTSAVFDDGDTEHVEETGNTSPAEANVLAEDLVSTTPAAVTTTTDATSIPGIPGIDYPTLGEIPQTGFDCQKQRYKGFFADIDTKCQAWHYCDFTDGHSTFLCPNGTLFSQVLLTCDWWFNVDCNQARQLYVLNERLYRYIKPPKPSFPEDFIGEHVDKWLLQQFTNGYLPKVRKKSKAKLVALPPPSPISSESEVTTTPRNETEV